MAENVQVAGWEDRSGNWLNVEAGDRAPSDSDLETSPRIVVSYEPEGSPEPVYFTTSYVTSDYPLEDVVEDAEDSDHYGEA